MSLTQILNWPLGFVYCKGIIIQILLLLTIFFFFKVFQFVNSLEHRKRDLSKALDVFGLSSFLPFCSFPPFASFFFYRCLVAAPKINLGELACAFHRYSHILLFFRAFKWKSKVGRSLKQNFIYFTAGNYCQTFY